MKVASSYAVEIKNINKKAVKETLEYYRKALAFLIPVADDNWDYIISFPSMLYQSRALRDLVHTTKNNRAHYAEFDKMFYKMPCYFLRACTIDAVGSVSSYRSNLEKNKTSKLGVNRLAVPAFYYDNMYKESNDGTASIKLRFNGDWKWFKLNLKKTDLKYIRKYWSHVAKSAPTLEKRHNKCFLRFSFEENVKLSENKNIVCAVDLGINNDAVCSILNKDGTILNRKFINFSSDKDHLYHVLNRIKGFQQKHGSHNSGSYWRYVTAINDELAKRTANSIVEFAYTNKADVIVFEHLEPHFKGWRSQKLHHWKKNTIQTVVEHKAHRLGMRISRVCAKYSSQLAFDGSGKVKRDSENYSLCTFTTGKRYNCDLNASYNIGARYFIRELSKSVPAKEWSRLLAKVPEAERRTSCTLNTLKQLVTA